MHRFLITLLALAAAGGMLHAGEVSEGIAPAAGGEEKATLDAARIEWSFDLSSFAATGNVRVVWGTTTITADHALGWPARNEAYLEGNVRMLTPNEEIRCVKAFINWASKEVVFEDFRARQRDKTKPLVWHVSTPLGMRIADGTYIARDAKVTNCDYAVPHNYLKARRVVIKKNNDVIATGITYYVRGVPMPFYLPAMYVPGGRPNISARAGSSSSLGYFGTLDLRVDLPIGFDAAALLRLGYYSKRGMGYGLGLDYKTPLIYRGEAEFYTVPRDRGEDVEGQPLGTTRRYRAQWFHSMDSPEGWELDLELQKYSDAGFQKEFFESDYYNAKTPETRIYAKRSSGNWAGYIEGKFRLNDYLDETERLPVGGLHGFSQPLGAGFLWTSDTQFGFLRRELSDIRLRPDDTAASFAERRRELDAFQDLPPITADELLSADRTVFRFDTIHEISRPFALNRLKVEPFVGVRETFYDTRLESERDVWRNQLFYGTRVSTSFYNMYDVDSDFLNIHGLRHVITPDILYVAKTDTWGANSDELIQLDERDGIRQEDKLALRLRNQFQTRRNGKVVDLLDLDLETDLYPHSDRDNNNESFSNLRVDARLRPADGLELFTIAEYDFRGKDRGLDFLGFGARAQLSRRWYARAAQTYERDLDHIGSYAVGYQLTEKWGVSFGYDRDWRSSRSLRERIELTRDFHEFNLSVMVENDERDHDQTVSVNLMPKALKMPPMPGSFVKPAAEVRDDTE